MKKLEGKTALITGGSGGIGSVVADILAMSGANIFFSYNSDHDGAYRVMRKIKDHGVDAASIALDLCTLSNVDLLVQEATKFFGTIDILVNSAGITEPHTDFFSIPLYSIKKMHYLNFITPFLLTQQVGKLMKEQEIEGTIINISSMSTKLLTFGSTGYECSKAALNNLTKSAAYHLAQYRIRVNSISPGSVATKINVRQRNKDPDGWDKRKNKLPLQQEGLPIDIANACLFLASDDSRWVTGVNIVVDGGASLMNPFY